ncbi:MAG: transposase, partial [Candidatus Lokiarchaeota archaeon]|nr:transposase [Candidatus Lokiarchaeota archaeon]
TMNRSYRSIEAKLRVDIDLAHILGFKQGMYPSDSVLKQYFAELKIKQLKSIMYELVNELRSLGALKCDIMALDSTPVPAYYRPPTEKGEAPTDPDARWGYSKSKDGWYYGYKAQIMVDTETQIPLICKVTPANVSDQKMVRPFVWILKKLGIVPNYTLLDKGYDSGNNHLELREHLGSIGLIAPNYRGSKKKTIRPMMKKMGKRLFKQLTLEKFIPIKTRKKAYRTSSSLMLNIKKYKFIYNDRISVERHFSSLKGQMNLEDHRMKGLKNVYKHTLLQCIAYLIVVLASERLGIPNAKRSLRFFQN